jgi:4,5-DOPA dioxygenase extradiol
MKRRNFLQSLITLSIAGAMNPIRALSDSLSEDGKRMPVLFIGHGSPTNAIDNNEFSLYWQKLGKELPVPKAIICVSAHWLTKGTHITAMEHPRTIHDFGGFSQELYKVQYPTKGNPELAKETKKLITHTMVGLDHDWGLDHGSWSVIKQMYPEANIPTLQLSIDYHKSASYHYELAKQLGDLRKKGVLILGSGNMVHNLGMAKMHGTTRGKNGVLNIPEYGYDWAIEINETFKKHIADGNHQALINYNKLGKSAQLAVPTPDHYYPLLYTLALQNEGEKATIFNDKCLAGSLSMTSVLIN